MDSVLVSTEMLRRKVLLFRRDAQLVPNALDERIWAKLRPPLPDAARPIRILYMGTATHARSGADRGGL